jgi:hypothetical protein
MDETLTCERAKPLLARLADDALDGAGRAALDGHLLRCAACRAEAEAQRAVLAVLRARPAAEAPPWLAARIFAEIAAESGLLGVADWRGWTFRLAPIAAGLLIAALVWGGLPSTSPAGVSLSPIVETWVMGDRTDGLPATAVFWQSDVSADTLLMTVLRSGPDDTLDTQPQDATK